MKFSLLSSASMIAFGGALASALPLCASQAFALPISGSSPIQIGGVETIGGSGDLLSASSFALTSATWHAGTHATPQFNQIPINTPIADSTLNVSSLGTFKFTSIDGSFTASPRIVVGTGSLRSAIVASSGSIRAGSESLSIYLVGTITPAGVLGAYTSDNASETISFTETGITASGFGSFSVSATFASPASSQPGSTGATPTPEPASGILLGAGLLGLGVIRRRRRG